jgi:hypothetical protein
MPKYYVRVERTQTVVCYSIVEASEEEFARAAVTNAFCDHDYSMINSVKKVTSAPVVTSIIADATSGADLIASGMWR